jgi:uncharacterized membrane protein YphA (DoxX/SURF4 family)
MKILITITRTLVGVLFIFSGLVKANDPLGLSYKMQEFFEVWNFHWLDHFTLAFSILMIVFEIVAGVALLLGWGMRLFSWLLLLLILFFTFLTGYAWLSGKVRECGCFGDCIPLTAGESFAKDLLLLLLIVFLFGIRNRIKPALPPAAGTAVFTGAAIFSFLFQWYVLVHLPVVDCLPYKAGTNIPDNMKPPPGSVPDSTVITMIYEKDGKRLEFDATHFPADFNDSYHFVSRYDKLIRKGNAEPAIKDFDLTTGDNTDTTDAVLSASGYKLFIFMKEVADDHPAYNKDLSVILTMAKAKQIPVFFVTGEYENMTSWVGQQGLTGQVTVLKCDGTAIKTAARANPTLYLIKTGTILRKWSYADFHNAIPAVNELPSQP